MSEPSFAAMCTVVAFLVLSLGSCVKEDDIKKDCERYGVTYLYGKRFECKRAARPTQEPTK